MNPLETIEPLLGYVAMSRIRSLAGLNFKEWFKGVHVSPKAIEFYKKILPQMDTDLHRLTHAKAQRRKGADLFLTANFRHQSFGQGNRGRIHTFAKEAYKFLAIRKCGQRAKFVCQFVPGIIAAAVPNLRSFFIANLKRASVDAAFGAFNRLTEIIGTCESTPRGFSTAKWTRKQFYFCPSCGSGFGSLDSYGPNGIWLFFFHQGRMA